MEPFRLWLDDCIEGVIQIAELSERGIFSSFCVPNL